MNKTLIIGDIHGKPKIIDKLAQYDHHLVFVGDYVDAYKNVAPEVEISCVTKVLDLVRKGKATMLLGNHEWSYLLDFMRASRWRWHVDAQLIPYKADMHRLSVPYVKLGDDVLITHAGVDESIWNKNKLSMSDDILFEGFVNGIRNQSSWYYAIGRTRGGSDGCGGPLWLDWSQEFRPIQGIRQVVGHSQNTRNPLHFKELGWINSSLRESENGDWNVDCLNRKLEVLEFDSGLLRPFKLK